MEFKDLTEELPEAGPPWMATITPRQLDLSLSIFKASLVRAALVGR